MLFSYKVKSLKDGVVKGTIEADSLRSAARALRKDGLDVVELVEATSKSAGKKKRSRGKASSKERLIAMQQLVTLLHSGLSLEDAVNSLSDEGQHPAIAEKFTQIGTSLRGGDTFSNALEQSGFELPLYFILLARSGELTGMLADSLDDGIKQWGQELEFITELRNALTYPLLLVVTGIISVLIIFALVVPKFSNLLAKGDADLPFLAVMVLSTGSFVNQYFLQVMVSIVALIGLSIYMWTQPKVREAWVDFLVRMPVVKNLILDSALYQWSAMLATLLANKVSLEKALELAQQCITVRSIRMPMSQVNREVRAGKSLSECLVKTRLLSTTGYNLIRVGEQSGKLAEMLRSLANILAASGRDRTKKFLLLVEPLAIICIGLVTGLIMAGVILAITSVNDITL